MDNEFVGWRTFLKSQLFALTIEGLNITNRATLMDLFYKEATPCVNEATWFLFVGDLFSIRNHHFLYVR